MHQATRTSEAFDPADAGTSEDRWLEALAGCPEWTPNPGSLLVVSPHPDDEVLAVGGLMHTWAKQGHPVTIVSVTDGEAAFPNWQGLDVIRRGELKGALRKLCFTHVSVIRLGLPDGKVSLHTNRLRSALLAMLDSSVTLIAPYEHDGHPDHEAVGHVCCELARSQLIPIARYPVWMWHHTEPGALGAVRWGKFPLSLEARRVKAHAAQCFASQLQPPHAAPIVPQHVLARFERPYEAVLL